MYKTKQQMYYVEGGDLYLPIEKKTKEEAYLVCLTHAIIRKSGFECFFKVADNFYGWTMIQTIPYGWCVYLINNLEKNRGMADDNFL